MAIPVARVHLAMAHAALPGLLPTPPKCAMLPAPPCAVILPNNSPPRGPSRADAAGRWDAHKTSKPAGSPASSSSSSSSSSGRQHSLGSNKKIVTLASSWSRTSPASSNGSSRADSEDRWDAHKRPASPAASSSSSSASSSKTKTCRVSRHCPNSRASSSSSAERWDAQKKPRAPQPADEFDDGESSTGSNDVESFMPRPPPPPRSLYAGPGFITSPEPSMLPKPSFMVRVA